MTEKDLNESFLKYCEKIKKAKDLSNEREIKNLTHFDSLFETMFFSPSEIDENGLILRLGFVNKILE